MDTVKSELESSNVSSPSAVADGLNFETAIHRSLLMLGAGTVSLDEHGVVVALPLRHADSNGIGSAMVGADYLDDVLRRTGLDRRGVEQYGHEADAAEVDVGETVSRALVGRIRNVIVNGGSIDIPADPANPTSHGVTLHVSRHQPDHEGGGATVVEVAHGTWGSVTEHRPDPEHQEAVLRALLSTIPYRIWWKDTESNYLGCNRIFADKAGVGSPLDIVGKNDFELPWGATGGEVMRADDREVMASGPKLEFRETVVQAESTIEVSTSKVPLIDDRGELIGVLGMFCDITEQVTTQRALADERSLLGQIVESLPFEVALKGRDHRFVGCNSAFAVRAGFASPEEVIGLRATELTGDRASVAFQEQDEDLMAAGEQLLHQQLIVTDDDGQPQQAELSRVPVRGADGSVSGLLILLVDTSERSRLEAQLADASKMEAIGQLASGVAHEINTPIQFVGDNIAFIGSTFQQLLPVLAQAEALAKAVATGEAAHESAAALLTAIEEADLEFALEEVPGAIEQSVEGIDRVTKIIRGLKEFAHPGGDEPEPSDVNHAIQSTVAVAANEWKYVADVQFDLAPDLPPVSCMPAKLAQALLVIIVNAAQAIGEANDGGSSGRGKIKLSTRVVGDACEIRIADDGPGMSKEVRDRIFEPFFTTKGVGVGSGQGLPIAQRIIITDHNGTLDVLSEVGDGTTFVIQIPIQAEPQR